MPPQARADLEGFITDYSGRRIPISVLAINDSTGRPINIGQYATGGEIHGPGTGTSDSILAMVSNGEWIVPAEQTRKNKALLQFINAGGTIPAFAGGGLVGAAAPSEMSPPVVVTGGSQPSGRGDVYIVAQGDSAELVRMLRFHIAEGLDAQDGAKLLVHKMGKQAYV